MYLLKVNWSPSETILILRIWYYYSLMFGYSFFLRILYYEKTYDKEKVNVEYANPLVYMVFSVLTGADLGMFSIVGLLSKSFNRDSAY